MTKCCWHRENGPDCFDCNEKYCVQHERWEDYYKQGGNGPSPDEVWPTITGNQAYEGHIPSEDDTSRRLEEQTYTQYEDNPNYCPHMDGQCYVDHYNKEGRLVYYNNCEGCPQYEDFNKMMNEDDDIPF